MAQVIEAINLFLAGEFPNCVFVLAMEPEVVVAHVEAAYPELMETLRADGRSGLGWRFLEKIVQLPLSVPLLDDADRLPGFVRALLGMTGAGETATPLAAGRDLAGGRGQPSGQRVPPYEGVSLMRAAVPPLQAASPPHSSVRRPPGTSRWWHGALGRSQAPVDVPLAVGGPHAMEPPDPEQVSRLEDAIWALQPTAANLDEVARRPKEVLGIECSDAISGLCSATREAADRVFDDLYSDENAYRAIEFVLPALAFFNPREIKRYVNVFRFYSFLTYRRTLAGAAPASDGEVAKLAALTIHWPHLLSLLVKETGKTTVLQELERAASLADDQIWKLTVRETGLAGLDDSDGAHLDSLRDLLSTPCPVAACPSSSLTSASRIL